MFRVRGDIVDLFPAHYEDRAWRIAYFGDDIESIREFDPLTGETKVKLNDITIFANSHYVTPMPTIERAIKQIKESNWENNWIYCIKPTSWSKRSGWSSARPMIWKCWWKPAVARASRIIPGS